MWFNKLEDIYKSKPLIYTCYVYSPIFATQKSDGIRRFLAGMAEAKNQQPQEDTMNDNLQTITLTKRDQNYSNLNGLNSSMLHSLRLDQNEYDDFERNPNAQFNNKITFKGIRQDLTPELAKSIHVEFQDFLQTKIRDTAASQDIAGEKEKLRKLKSKLNKFLKETDVDSISNYVESAMELKSEFIPDEYSSLLNEHGIKRINQRIELLGNYIDKKKEIETTMPNRAVSDNTNRIKEVFLTIPSTNNLPITEEYTKLTQRALYTFYKENFPNNEIILAVEHLDETSNHSHIFIDLENSKTKKYDFNEQEQEFALNYYETHKEILGLERPPVLEDFKIPNRTEERQRKRYIEERQSWKSSILQKAFYEHFNKMALEYGLKAKFLPKNEEQKSRMRIIEEQAKKPKSERAFNYYTKQIDDLMKQIQESNMELEQKNELIQNKEELIEKYEGKQSELINALNEKIEEQKVKDAEIKKSNQVLQEQKTKISNNNESILILDNTISSKRIAVSELNKTLTQKDAELKTVKEDISSELAKLKKAEEKNKNAMAENEKLNKSNKRLQHINETINNKLSVNIARLDSRMDKMVRDIRVCNSSDLDYKIMKEEIIDTVKHYGKEMRKDFLFHWEANMQDKGLDFNKVKPDIKDNIKLWCSDKLTSTQVIEFDAEEKVEAAKARKRRRPNAY